jgi:hypothetical protein
MIDSPSVYTIGRMTRVRFSYVYLFLCRASPKVVHVATRLLKQIRPDEKDPILTYYMDSIVVSHP